MARSYHERKEEKFCTQKNFHFKKLYWLLWRHRWWTCHRMISYNGTKRMSTPKLYLLKDVKLNLFYRFKTGWLPVLQGDSTPLQAQWSHPAHTTCTPCRGELPILCGCCAHTSCCTQIPEWLPVQQLSSLKCIISLTRLSQVKVIWSPFPSPLPRTWNTRETEWICGIKLTEVLWTVLYAKGKTVPIKLD